MNDSQSHMPDEYDRLFGSLDGLPDVTKTKASTITVTPPLGIGGSRTFIVQTIRQKDVGDIVFLQTVGSNGSLRLALLPAVTDAVARQRDALSTLSRKKAGRAAAADRKARGEKPGFKMTPAERAARKAAKR